MVSDEKMRIQISMPRDLVARMDTYCKSVGISRSDYLSLCVTKDLDDSKIALEKMAQMLLDLAASDK